MNAQFVNPWMLFFLWLVPAVAVWWITVQRSRERQLQRFVSTELQKKLRPKAAAGRQAWQAGLIICGSLLLLIAAARPQWGMKEERVHQRGRDLLICLDVSRSMLANDVHPNRLQRAKADILDLIKELRGDRAGLLAFRHKAALLCPLTTDYAYLRQALDAVDIDSAPRGATDIGDAIGKALDHFDESEGSHKAIILISDGEDLSGRAAEAAGAASERGIPIFTVGIGDRRGTRIPDAEARSGYAQYRGNDVVTSLDNETLYAIAEKTGGAYIPVETASMTSVTLGTLYRDHLRNITARDLEESLQRRYIERYQMFLLPGVLCLLLGAGLSRGRLARGKSQRSDNAEQRAETRVQETRDITPPSRQPRNVMAVIIGLITLSSICTAGTNDISGGEGTNTVEAAVRRDVPPGRAGARMAQRLYALGKYEAAAETYLEAVKGSTRQSQEDFRFNAAIARFKAGKYKDAADLLRGLDATGEDRTVRTATGLGTALFKAANSLESGDEHETTAEQARLLKESGEAFREAARLRQDDEAGSRNLAVALRAWREAGENARIAKLTHQYKDAAPDRIAADMLSKQREVNEGMRAAFTNEAPSRIAQLEALAEQQSAAADLWIPLKGKLLEAMSQNAKSQEDQQKLAQFESIVEATRENMLQAAGHLRDLEPYARETGLSAEAAVYHFWKGIASFPELLREDIRLQTNIIDWTVSPRADDPQVPVKRQSGQEEAGRLTQLFAERFTESVPEGGSPSGEQEAGADTNAPSISAEDRAKILDLAKQAVAAQEQASAILRQEKLEEALTGERTAHRLLKEIEELLPKSQQSESQQSSPSQSEQEQKQEQQQKPQEQEQSEAEQQQPQEPQEKQEAAEEKDPPPKEDETPKDIRALLDKALQREKEHEEEMRRRQRHIPMGPIDKDW